MSEADFNHIFNIGDNPKINNVGTNVIANRVDLKQVEVTSVQSRFTQLFSFVEAKFFGSIPDHEIITLNSLVKTFGFKEELAPLVMCYFNNKKRNQSDWLTLMNQASLFDL